MRFFFAGLRKIFPVLLIVARAVGWSFIMTIATIWVGAPTAVKNLADHWEEEGLKRGVSTAYARQLNWAVRVVACVVIAFEWVCFSFTTVYLIVFLFWIF